MSENQIPPPTPVPNSPNKLGENWERETIEKLLFAALKEQRRARHWSIFFKLLGFGYLIVLLLIAIDWNTARDALSDGKHTALVELNGVIALDSEASAERVMNSLQAAFKDKGTKGVILRVNSPGGSPVQSSLINDEIQRLRKKYPEIPIYTVVEDICASGGYFVAAATDKIYVNKASLVGSIGVLMGGFGFTGTMEKLGIERRLMTAGENKGFLDPFSPQLPKHKQQAQKMLNQIHQQFIAVVKQGRGTRLKDNPDLFSGFVWTGEESIDLGLADGFGSMESVAREVIKAEDIVDYTQRERLSERLAKRLGAGMSSGLSQFFTSRTLN